MAATLEGGHSGRVGRPRLVTSVALETIAGLRLERYSWKQIGLRVGLNPETCRRALWAVKKAGRAVGNSPVTVNNPAPEA